MHAVVVVEDRALQGQVIRAGAGEERGQADAVIRMAVFLADHGDAPGALGIAAAQALDEPVGDHSRADDDDVRI